MTDSPDPPVVKQNAAAIVASFQSLPSTQVALDIEGAQAQGKRYKNFDRYLHTCAALIFAYWSARTNHPAAIFDPKRERTIVARLRESGGNVDEGLFVVKGLFKDHRLMGDNGRDRKYDGIETIFRDRAMVERLAELGGYEGQHHPMAVKYLHLNGTG